MTRRLELLVLGALALTAAASGLVLLAVGLTTTTSAYAEGLVVAGAAALIAAFYLARAALQRL